MRFECDSCHAKYKISDDKVRGRIVRFPCRKCSHKILIDGRKAEADATVPAGAAYSFQEITRKSHPVSEFRAHEAATARARRPSSPARRRPPSVPPRRPSAVSRRVSSVPAIGATALAGQHPGLAPPVPAAAAKPANDAADVPEWHVSINDVPVGPIRLEEMGHKIDAGAVSEYSLVWREGFEEWRPLAAVPKLMSLLHERRHSGPPARSTFSSMPPFVETRSSTSLVEPSAPAAVPAPPPAFAGPSAIAGDAELTPLADALQPELEAESGVNQMSQPPAPIGPEDVFESSPQLGSFSGLPPTLEEPVSVPPVPPEPAASTAEPRRGLSVGVLALIVAVAVFSGVIAFLAFDRFGDRLFEKWMGGNAPAKTESPVESPAAAPAPVEAEAPEAPESANEPATDASELDEPVEEVASDSEEPSDVSDDSVDAEEPSESEAAALVPPPDPNDNAPKLAPARESTPRARRRARAKPAPAASDSGLSADEQKILDEFGSGADQAPAKIDVKEAGSTKSKKPPLDSDAILSTVAANKPRLQRCYERAIRGQQSPGTVRLDVSVTVAASGRVKNVTSEGSGPGGLAECIEASVRRWRFPASSEGGPAKFPLVFSAN